MAIRKRETGFEIDGPLKVATRDCRTQQRVVNEEVAVATGNGRDAQMKPPDRIGAILAPTTPRERPEGAARLRGPHPNGR